MGVKFAGKKALHLNHSLVTGIVDLSTSAIGESRRPSNTATYPELTVSISPRNLAGRTALSLTLLAHAFTGRTRSLAT